jgi:hypothetical protein
VHSTKNRSVVCSFLMCRLQLVSVRYIFWSPEGLHTWKSLGNAGFINRCHICEILGFHCDEDSSRGLLGCDRMLIFQRTMLPPSLPRCHNPEDHYFNLRCQIVHRSKYYWKLKYMESKSPIYIFRGHIYGRPVLVGDEAFHRTEFEEFWFRQEEYGRSDHARGWWLDKGIEKQRNCSGNPPETI